MVTRAVNAENRFIEFAMDTGDLDRAQAEHVLRVYRKAKVVKIDPVMGQFELKHGVFAGRDALRRASTVAVPHD
jgi:hypothetical protein